MKVVEGRTEMKGSEREEGRKVSGRKEGLWKRGGKKERVVEGRKEGPKEGYSGKGDRKE